MTSAYSETPTERIPGRAWTVRLTGHSDRSATVTCTTTACRMPPRSKDLATLRAFAAQMRPHPDAACHCRAQKCASHPEATVHCAGAVVLILRHDPTVGWVWSVEEVCAARAPLLPNVTGLARAAKPGRTGEQPAAQVPVSARPAVPGGFSSPTATPAEAGPAPAGRSRRSPNASRSRRMRQGR